MKPPLDRSGGGRKGGDFGPEMTVLANSVKTRFALWQDDEDIPPIYTVPSKTLAPKLTQPEGIRGKNTAVELGDRVKPPA